MNAPFQDLNDAFEREKAVDEFEMQPLDIVIADADAADDGNDRNIVLFAADADEISDRRGKCCIDRRAAEAEIFGRGQLAGDRIAVVVEHFDSYVRRNLISRMAAHFGGQMTLVLFHGAARNVPKIILAART